MAIPVVAVAVVVPAAVAVAAAPVVGAAGRPGGAGPVAHLTPATTPALAGDRDVAVVARPHVVRGGAPLEVGHDCAGGRLGGRPAVAAQLVLADQHGLARTPVLVLVVGADPLLARLVDDAARRGADPEVAAADPGGVHDGVGVELGRLPLRAPRASAATLLEAVDRTSLRVLAGPVVAAHGRDDRCGQSRRAAGPVATAFALVVGPCGTDPRRRLLVGHGPSWRQARVRFIRSVPSPGRADNRIRYASPPEVAGRRGPSRRGASRRGPSRRGWRGTRRRPPGPRACR